MITQALDPRDVPGELEHWLQAIGRALGQLEQFHLEAANDARGERRDFARAEHIGAAEMCAEGQTALAALATGDMVTVQSFLARAAGLQAETARLRARRERAKRQLGTTVEEVRGLMSGQAFYVT